MRYMTKKLYLDDPYKTTFEADVVSSEGKKIVLDQTCFYPTSGGQPCDCGYLNGKKILDVYKDGGEIVHVIEESIEEKKVTGTVDWQRRFEHMQQHTGQHILSRSFIDCFGERAYSTSLHIGSDHNTIDIFGNYTEDDTERVEILANTVIHENRKIRTYVAEREEIAEHLRKVPDGIQRLRVVEIEGFDLTACGGTHLHRTGEVGMIKITETKKKGEFTRVVFVCGMRALREYIQKNRQVNRAVDLLDSPHIIRELEKLKKQETDLQKKIREVEEIVSVYEVDEMIKRAENMGKYKAIMKIYESQDIEKLIKAFDQDNIIVFLADRSTTRIMGFSRVESLHIGTLMKEIGVFIGGGGGGSENFGKAGGKNPEGIEEAFTYIKEKIKNI
jgi:alanyl-tRNA synthetase